MSDGLVMDAATHTYYFQKRVVPGVTNSLKRAGIIDYTGVPQRILERAAERGRNVHLALDYLDRDTLAWDSLADEYKPYLQAYESFCRDTGFVPGAAERSRINVRRWYAGTFDRIGFFEREVKHNRQTGEPDYGSATAVLLDFKTGEFFEGHFAQLAAYSNFDEKPQRFRQIALQLKADGKYNAHELPPGKFGYYSNVFFAALACAQFAERKAS